MFYELYQLPVVIGRIFMAYGPGQRDLKKLIPYTILSLSEGRAPRLGSGSRPFDWIYVDDVIQAFLILAQSAGVNGQTVEIGTGELHTAREAVEMIVDLFGNAVTPEYGVVPDRKLEVARSANVAATENTLSWRSEVPLRDGLARTIEWYCCRATGAQKPE
jgi:nucleoside-diphosphate-sugar epimerase